MKVFAYPDGTVKVIYTDDFDFKAFGGPIDIKRASHVEPVPDGTGSWMADMTPMGGPVMMPFPARAAALAAEVAWLEGRLAMNTGESNGL